MVSALPSYAGAVGSILMSAFINLNQYLFKKTTQYFRSELYFSDIAIGMEIGVLKRYIISTSWTDKVLKLYSDKAREIPWRLIAIALAQVPKAKR